jgi:hypothetical protein
MDLMMIITMRMRVTKIDEAKLEYNINLKSSQLMMLRMNFAHCDTIKDDIEVETEPNHHEQYEEYEKQVE